MIKLDLVFILLYFWPMVSGEAVIGKWKQLNTRRCGISRLTGQLTSECFVWHNSDDLSKVMNGRNASNGEAPWDVAIVRSRKYRPTIYEFQSQCAGAIIADQWVLTAAHCVDPVRRKPNTTEVRRHGELAMITGNNFTINKWMYDWFAVLRKDIEEEEFKSKYHTYWGVNIHVHPNYGNVKQMIPGTNKSEFDIHHDIALVKLDRPIDSSNYNGYSWPFENSICLPTEDWTGVEHDEYSFAGGWGYSAIAHAAFGNDPLVLAPRKVIAKHNKSILIVTRDVPSIHASLCKGDSGAPLWQYDRGRAVLIGILNGSPGVMCSSVQGSEGWVVYDTIHARVSRYIDWIIDVTGLDKDHFAETGHSAKFVDYYREVVDCRDTGECT